MKVNRWELVPGMQVLIKNRKATVLGRNKTSGGTKVNFDVSGIYVKVRFEDGWEEYWNCGELRKVGA